MKEDTSEETAQNTEKVDAMVEETDMVVQTDATEIEDKEDLTQEAAVDLDPTAVAATKRAAEENTRHLALLLVVNHRQDLTLAAEVL